MKDDSRKILISPLFLIGLFVLLLNDFVLKAQFNNFLTGKLSDFAGLFVFALFWTALFPKFKTFIFSFTAIFFTFWKSSYSSGFIDAWNAFAPFGIGRTVDLTDLIAFAILPFAWIYSEKYEPVRLPAFSQNYALAAIALVSVFAFTATSPPRVNYHSESFTDVYRINKTPIDVLKKLQEFQTEEFYESKTRKNYPVTVSLKLNEKVCDYLPHASFEIKEDGAGGSQIELKSISYECNVKMADNTDDKQKLLEYREQLKANFEKEVLEFMKS